MVQAGHLRSQLSGGCCVVAEILLAERGGTQGAAVVRGCWESGGALVKALAPQSVSGADPSLCRKLCNEK